MDTAQIEQELEAEVHEISEEDARLEARKQGLHIRKDKAKEVAIARRGAACEVPAPKKRHPSHSGPY